MRTKCWAMHVRDGSWGDQVTNYAREGKDIICFARMHFGKRKTMGYYFGAVIYVNMDVNNGLNSGYWKYMMSVCGKGFQKYSGHMRHDVKDSQGRIYHAWIFRVVFKPLRFNKNPRYLESDSTTSTVRYTNARQSSDNLVQKWFPQSSLDLELEIKYILQHNGILRKERDYM